jgi:uncharacterized protein YbjT (DUF2867 family)
LRNRFELHEYYVGKTIELAGDKLTMRQFLEMLTYRIGCEVNYEEMPIDRLRNINSNMASMYEWLNKYGYKADIESLRTRYPDLMKFDSWLYNHGWDKACISKAA